MAISLHVLPASRICFNLCSSVAVQGVFVRAFRAGLSLSAILSGDNKSVPIDMLDVEVPSVVTGPGGGFTFKGRCSADGLGDAGLLRGFGGESIGGGAVLSIDRGSSGIGEGYGSSDALGEDDSPEFAVRGRLAGGGVLAAISDPSTHHEVFR